MERTDDLCLLILSCDLYESVWIPYLKLLKKNWPEHPKHIYLVTEEKECQCDFLEIKTIRTGKEMVWSDRLKFALSKIPFEYILYTLEDYFIFAPVHNSGFVDALGLLKENTKWGGYGFIRSDENVSIRQNMTA